MQRLLNQVQESSLPFLAGPERPVCAATGPNTQTQIPKQFRIRVKYLFAHLPAFADFGASHAITATFHWTRY